ncbi:hypothetical protein [Williamsia sp. CHRR-6]|uniref:hypothetical protein n=1 Tax=Williamsia sp. CHRR-6 TaxID=2835871 RepID=UPI001BD98613|nr:hypothetical protein [Williamsia sp. CHRR-6]MBT0567669.1 hypothetical protein [Williamsia sp. CHRR-6]
MTAGLLVSGAALTSFIAGASPAAAATGPDGAPQVGVISFDPATSGNQPPGDASYQMALFANCSAWFNKNFGISGGDLNQCLSANASPVNWKLTYDPQPANVTFAFYHSGSNFTGCPGTPRRYVKCFKASLSGQAYWFSIYGDDDSYSRYGINWAEAA